MLFNSLHYLLFFPAATSLYFLTPYRWRWLPLLLAGYYFYMAWVPAYALILVASTIATYFAAIGIGSSSNPLHRKICVSASLLVNFGMLAVFKYYDFFAGSINVAANVYGLGLPRIPFLRLLLPIGVSFHTFQAVSYTLDVYSGKVRPERHLGIFSVYSCFFPQLVAGPIERPGHLLPQFHERFRFDHERVADGLRLMAWGIFQKVVIADNLGVYVKQVYDNPRGFGGASLAVATYLFAFQILCDFSGYTDIARGSAKVMGFELMKNFDRPYFSKSVAEFWRRWHISLSSWFRDYLYVPLGGNRVDTSRRVFNIIVVFLVCGLWHGAGWTFLVWGGLHGLYMASSLLTRDLRARAYGALGLDPQNRLVSAFRVFVTFNLVCAGWVFFRADSIADALYILTHFFEGAPAAPSKALPLSGISVCIGLIVLLAAVQAVQARVKIREYLARRHFVFRWACYLTALAAILALGRFDGSDFIYFRF